MMAPPALGMRQQSSIPVFMITVMVFVIHLQLRMVNFNTTIS